MIASCADPGGVGAGQSMITVEIIAVEAITVEAIVSCADPGGVDQ